MAKVGPRPKNEPPPKCSCGCGEAVAWQPGHGWSKFRPGHQSRRQKSNAELSGPAPLCACGCEQKVAWHRGKGKRGGWGKWIRGHHLRVEGAKNPNDGDHCRGDKNPMKRVEVRNKVAEAHRGMAKPGCAQFGEDNGRWVGGRIVDKHGYVRLRIDGCYVAEHRYVMERHLGRPLEEDEIVHHKNGDKGDNRLENLEILTQSEHCRLHSTLGDLGPFCGCGCGMRTQQSADHPGLWHAILRGHHLRLPVAESSADV